MCYHARLQHRLDYEVGVAAQFQSPLGLPGKAEELRNEIKWYVHTKLTLINFVCISGRSREAIRPEAIFLSPLDLNVTKGDPQTQAAVALATTNVSRFKKQRGRT